MNGLRSDCRYTRILAPAVDFACQLNAFIAPFIGEGVCFYVSAAQCGVYHVGGFGRVAAGAEIHGIQRKVTEENTHGFNRLVVAGDCHPSVVGKVYEFGHAVAGIGIKVELARHFDFKRRIGIDNLIHHVACQHVLAVNIVRRMRVCCFGEVLPVLR